VSSAHHQPEEKNAMISMRKSAWFVAVAGLLAAMAEPAAAQYQPYPGQPYPPPPGPRGRFAHACFPAEQGGYLRIEWPQSGRWAVFNWPPGSNLRIYIGEEYAQWCWSPQFGTATRACRPNPEVTKAVQPGC
jgi:hypothetical protein